MMENFGRDLVWGMAILCGVAAVVALGIGLLVGKVVLK